MVVLGCMSTKIVHAAPVISEVMWMGTSLSTSDEWIEIVNTDAVELDVSGYTITSLNSKGVDATIATFPSGTMIPAESSIIVSNFSAQSSRLLLDPKLISTSMSLPNTKLLLKLIDPTGTVIDTVDDGVGNPFGGANPSGGVKASMERIDCSASGVIASNWTTATTSSGFDADAPELGTPGSINCIFPRTSNPVSDPFSSSASVPSVPSVTSNDSFSSTDYSLLTTNSSSTSVPSVPSTTSVPSVPSSSCLSFSVSIHRQDGELSGVGKTTVNFQAVATVGSIDGATCSWEFSDGYRSTSCNPPPHAFTNIGVTTINLTATSSCGVIATATERVTVLSDGMDTAVSPSSVPDLSKVILVRALPNPDGADTGHEWIELRNLEDHVVDLSTWSLGVGETTIQDRKSTRLNSSHVSESRMPSSA